ncbi:hypothetical protein C8R41DRAFT_869540 [Lentinula lateritia]|uniref:Fungal-type protein kinase domain-containing protein n=1 Tax=Lentinula lateritia TaxID=40482 RepID=A0ABQ8V707_9AGAR|nr:hypothetical protein C8R41DRAFT_869540 [Lentinula lateritia]
MSTPSTAVESTSHVVAPPMPTPPSPSHPPFATGENDIDELASTVEDPPLGHLTLFKWVFGVGVSLAWFLEIHGDPGQRTRFSLLPEQWKIIAEKIESSTSSTWALLELSSLDDQDRLKEDHLALQDFIHRQPKLSTIVQPVPSHPPSPPAPAKASLVPKKRKRAVRVDEASSSKRKRSGEQDLGVGTAPDYRRVVLVLRPQAGGRPEVVEPLTPVRPPDPDRYRS